MSPPTWSVGQVLTASDVNTWFVPLAVDKGSDQQVVSSTTLVNDNALVLAVAANAVYAFECWIAYIGPAGGDIKWTWAVPASAALGYDAYHNEGGGTGTANSLNAYADTDTLMAAASSPTVTIIRMKGHFQTAGTAGNLQFKWAQNTSNGSATHVRATSFLKLDRIG